MGSKRKRESSVAESPKSIPASTEAHPELGTRLKSSTSRHGDSDVETGSRSAVKKGPEVQYIAAEASDSWSKRLGESAQIVVVTLTHQILNAIMRKA